MRNPSSPRRDARGDARCHSVRVRRDCARPSGTEASGEACGWGSAVQFQGSTHSPGPAGPHAATPPRSGEASWAGISRDASTATKRRPPSRNGTPTVSSSAT